MELLQILNPHSIKICPCKSSIWTLTLSNSHHRFSLMCVFKNSIGNCLWKKTVFWRTACALLGLFAGMGSSFRENGGCITSSNTFSVVLYVPDFVFFECTSFSSSWQKCFAVVCAFSVNHRGFCNLKFELPIDKICSEIVAWYPRVRASVSRLSQFVYPDFIQILSPLYSKRWKIIRQCPNKLCTLNIYRMTQANFVDLIIHSETIWFILTEVFLICRGWNSQTIWFAWGFGREQAKQVFVWHMFI